MDELKTFKKIVYWMLNKQGISTNDILAMADISIKHYQLIMDGGVDPKHITVALKAAIQDFNKKYFSGYMEAIQLEKLDDDPNFEPDPEPVEDKAELEPNNEKVKQIEESHVESNAINDLLYSDDRNSRRVAERAQEKIFNEALQRLRDVTPDHMTFDIILKHR